MVPFTKICLGLLLAAIIEENLSSGTLQKAKQLQTISVEKELKAILLWNEECNAILDEYIGLDDKVL